MEYEDCLILRSIGLPKDRIHPTAVVCGNMSRFKEFAEHGTKYREFDIFLCYKAAEIEVDGQMILIVCHGVSSSSASPILRELMEMGVKVILRAGTCGTYKPSSVKCGDLLVPFACVRNETSSLSEVDVRYPSVADYEVVDCILDVAKDVDTKLHLGIAYTSDHFYNMSFKPDHRDVFAHKGLADVEEAEVSTVYVMASLYGAKAGAILIINGSTLEWGLGKYYSGSSQLRNSKKTQSLLVIRCASALNKKYFS